MSSSISAVRSWGINSGIRPNNKPSNLKTYAFALAIIVDCIGLIVGLIGLGGYLQTDSDSIKSSAMLAAGGSAVIHLLFTGIISPLKNCWQKRYQLSRTSAGLEFISGRNVPHEIANYIFSFLTPVELGSTCRVSKSWNASIARFVDTADYKKIFPLLQIIDKQVWNKHVKSVTHGVSFDDLEAPNKLKLMSELNTFSSLPIEDDEGFTLLTIPKGISINKLRLIVSSSIQGEMYSKIDEFVPQNIKQSVTDKSYRMLISNTVLNGSRNTTFEFQKQFVQDGYKCEIPSVLEVLILIWLTQMETGRTLYAKEPGTATVCSDKDFIMNIIVWGKGSLTCATGGNEYIGCSALRKIS